MAADLRTRLGHVELPSPILTAAFTAIYHAAGTAEIRAARIASTPGRSPLAQLVPHCWSQ